MLHKLIITISTVVASRTPIPSTSIRAAVVVICSIILSNL